MQSVRYKEGSSAVGASEVTMNWTISKVDSTSVIYLEYWIGEQEVSVDIILTKLFTGIQAERTILVINRFLSRIAQNAVSMVYFLELNIHDSQSNK